jgi:hypothetical protein
MVGIGADIIYGDGRLVNLEKTTVEMGDREGFGGAYIDHIGGRI